MVTAWHEFSGSGGLQLCYHLLFHDDLYILLLLLLHCHLLQQAHRGVVVDVLMATQGVARVEAFLALVAVKRARVVVDCLHMVALY